MVKNKIILFLPHSSIKLPHIFKKHEKLLSDSEIKFFNMSMTDLYTDKLFSSYRFCNIKSRVSRIVCDCEKFIDDSKECMSKFGLGVVYMKTHQGKKFINIDEKYKNKILNKFYFPVHKKLDKKTKNLNKKTIILVDCHSFSKDIVLDQKGDFPDICIGINEKYIDKNIIDFTTTYFQTKGYKTRINYPYVGAMIPDNIYDKNIKYFYTIMIEINRDLYLKNFKKNFDFYKLKKIIYNYLKKLRKIEIGEYYGKDYHKRKCKYRASRQDLRHNSRCLFR